MPDLLTLQEALERSWGPDTAQATWDPRNPARGQCAVSSLLLQRYLGGSFLRGTTNNGTVHYWNQFGGAWYDSTRSQFGSDEHVVSWEVAPAEPLFMFNDTWAKLTLLDRRVRYVLQLHEVA